jgi:type II secretory pathway component GspD/PulD (secretin)
MKSKFIVLSLAGLLASGLVALAQNDAPATTAPSTTNAVTPAATDTNTPPATTTTNAVAPTATPAEATTPATTTNAAPATPTTAPTTAPGTPEATPAPATGAARENAAVIPLIQMEDVPLTDAIKNLARQAGINYMLDPKINYGAPSPDGRPNPQPMVSLRWENLTPDQALNAVLNNYNLTMIEDTKTHISRITVKDPAAPEPLVSSTIQLKYADPTNILTSVQTALVDKRSKVVVDGRTAQLVVLATDKELESINKLVEQLDTPTKQVLIEARLVETSKSPRSVKGIDWTGTFGAQTVRFGNNAPFLVQPSQNTVQVTQTNSAGVITSLSTLSSVVPGILSKTLDPTMPLIAANTMNGFDPATFFLNADGVSAVLSFLNTDADARILSTPRAVTLDNQLAVLSVTRAQPIFATTAGTQGSPGGSQVTYTNVGTILKVTPHISANNTINLKVVPEVSDVAGIATKTVAGVVNQADIFDVRRIETQVLIPSGNTLVMGGLVSDSTTKGNIKVPILGDIPLLGVAFRQSSKAQDKKNLLIFITPTIVQSEDFQPTQTEFLKTKMPPEESHDFGPWDSGKPQDWSKLFGRNKNADTEMDSSAKFPDSK